MKVRMKNCDTHFKILYPNCKIGSELRFLESPDPVCNFLIITIRNTAGRSGVSVKLWIRLHPDLYQFFPRIRIFNLWHPDVELSVFELSFSLALVRMLKVIRSRSPKTNHTAICGRSGPLQLEPLILFVKKSNAALSWLITFFTVLFTFHSILFCRCLRIRVLSPRIEFVRQD